MVIYDSHCHIFPDKIAMKAAENIGRFYDEKMFASAEADILVAEQKKAGISLSLVCSSAVTKDQVEKINDFIAASCRKYPTFYGLGTMHPDYENIEGELDRIVSLGLHGIKLHPDFQLFNIDDENAMKIYEGCSERSLPVLFHMGDDRYDYSSPKRLQRVADVFPDLKIHAAHFGGYSVWDEAYATLKPSEKMYFDLSSSLFKLDKVSVRRFFDKYGVDKFMYGSDFPMWSPSGEIARVEALGLTDDEKELIYHENFERFYLSDKR